MRKMFFVFVLSLLLISSIAYAQEIGYSNKIEEAILNCTSCNLCPDGKEIEKGKICFYLFWGQGCPHCAQEKIFLEELKTKYPNLEIYDFEIYYNSENTKFWREICAKYNVQPIGVPMSFVGNKAFIGFAENPVSETETFTKMGTSNVLSQTFLIVVILAFVVLVILLIIFFKKIRIKVKI
jgi:thiol-disulfide isomerase/thioredoxin